MIAPEGNNAFETFGVSHWVAMGAIALAAAGLLVIARAARSRRLTRTIAWALAAVLLGNEAVYLRCSWVTQSPSQFVQNALPLHICGMGIFLTAWVLLAPRQRIYEIAYFWGLAGTVQAILTPSVMNHFPSIWYFIYFIGHGTIVVGVLFATIAMKLRPARGAMVRIARSSLADTRIGTVAWGVMNTFEVGRSMVAVGGESRTARISQLSRSPPSMPSRSISLNR